MKSLLMTALTFCGILFGLAATPAKAVTQDLTCLDMEAQTFSPGLLLMPQTVSASVKDSFGPCLSLALTLKSGVSPSTVKLTLSCLTVNNTRLINNTRLKGATIPVLKVPPRRSIGTTVVPAVSPSPTLV